MARQTDLSTDYSAAGKKNLETVAAAVVYNGYIERLVRRFVAPLSSAVDFGAGTGEFVRRLRKAGISVTCVEPDAELKQALLDDGFAVADGISACRGAERVYSLNVLEHIEDDAAALRDIHAALAPGGRLLLYVPAFMQIYTDIDRAVGHYRRYTRPELERLLRGAGFAVGESRYVDSLGFIAWALLKWLGRAGKGELNGLLVVLYDRLCFPVSLLADFFLGRWVGKNALVVGVKP